MRDGGFTVGQQITFTALSGRAELNGTHGILTSWDPGAGRWTVALEGGGSVGVRLTNLEAVTFLKGQRVTLGGLTGRADLNGAPGTLESWDPDTGRWLVALSHGSEAVNVRVGNLRGALGAGGKKGTGKVTSEVRADLRKAKAKTKAKVKAKAASRAPLPSKAIPLAKKAPPGTPMIRKTMLKRKAMPQKPKRAASAYMLFCNKVRPQVIGELRQKYGSADLPDIARELGERWGDLEDKEKTKFERLAKKRKQTHDAKMQVYQEAVDPLGALKRKYHHLIPKRPASPYFLFSADQAQRQKAAGEVHKAKRQKVEDGSEAKLNSKLAEMWNALPDKDKEPYVAQHGKAKAEFEKKNKIWQQSKEYAEIERVERDQKAAERAEKQVLKLAEDAEIQALLKEEGVVAGQGLAEGRRAFITGLTQREDLNGREVVLLDLSEDNVRWRVKLVGASDEQNLLNLRPQNLILTRLQREARRVELKEQQRAEKMNLKEAKTNARAVEKQEAEAAARTEKNKQKEAERAARELQKEAEVAAKEAAKNAAKAIREEQKQAERAAKELQTEAEKAAKDEQKEAARAAKAAERDAARAARDMAKEAAQAAVQAARAEQKAIETAAKAAAKEASRAAREAVKDAQRALKDAARESQRVAKDAVRGVAVTPFAAEESERDMRAAAGEVTATPSLLASLPKDLD